MVQGYYTEEAVEWALNYTKPSNPIVMRGSLQEKGPLGKRL
jgi:hypothetical protein